MIDDTWINMGFSMQKADDVHKTFQPEIKYTRKFNEILQNANIKFSNLIVMYYSPHTTRKEFETQLNNIKTSLQKLEDEYKKLNGD